MKTVSDSILIHAPCRRTLRVHRAGGFTLVELIVVLIITGIMAAVAIPKLSNQTLRDVAYKDQVKAAFEFARKSAVARRRYTCVVVNGSGNVSLSAELETPENHAGACPYTALNLPGRSSNTITPPTGVTVSGTLTVMFNAEGRPTTATLPTTTTLTITDSAGMTSSLVIEAGSGYVHD